MDSLDPTIPILFSLTKYQQTKFTNWSKQFHTKGSFTFSVTPTDLGNIVIVRHSNGAELDLTELDLAVY